MMYAPHPPPTLASITRALFLARAPSGIVAPRSRSLRASNPLFGTRTVQDVEEVRRLLVLEGISAKVDAPPADAKKGGGGWFGSWSSTKSDSSMSPLSAAAEVPL